MNQQLEEFNKLRLVYSGRIDAAIRLDDKEDLDKAKEEYNNIISKYLDLACDVLSSHTNKPFVLYEERKGKKRLKSSKKISNDINNIRNSMEKIKLSNEDKMDIKSAINVISDYYNKVIINDNEVSHKDSSSLKFRLIFSIFIVPIVITLISMFNILFINKFSDIELYTLLSSFLSLNVKILIKNSFSTVLMLQYLLLIIVDLGTICILYKIFSNKSRKSIFNNKKFMIIPIAIMQLLLIFIPYNMIFKNNFYAVETITLIILLSNIFFVIIILTSLLSNDYSSGDYKSPLNIIETILLIIMIFTILIPFLYNLVGNYIDLSFISNNFIVKDILLSNIFVSIIKYVYLILTLFLINIEIYQNNKEKLLIVLTSIIISLVLIALCIYLDASGNLLNFM